MLKHVAPDNGRLPVSGKQQDAHAIHVALEQAKGGESSLEVVPRTRKEGHVLWLGVGQALLVSEVG